MDDATSVLSPDFQALFEAAPNLYLVLSPDLTIVAVSDAYCRATMTERAKILGRGLFEVFPDNPDDPAATGVDNLRASLARVLQHGRPDAMAVQKYDIRRPDSEGGGFEERYWAPLNSPVLDQAGKVVWIIHRVEDVTEMVRLQAKEEALARHADSQQAVIERLQRTSSFLDAVIDNLPGMLFIKAFPDFRFVLINRAGEELLGYTREQYLGKTDYDFFPKAEADHFRIRDCEVLDSGQLQVTPEETITTRDRGVRLMRTTKVPVKDKDGNPQYLLGFSEDITERKAIEQQLRQAVKMEAVGQLTGGVAHDFNNLLGIIIGNLDIAAEHAKDAALRETIQEALGGALRGAELTRRLLAFSRNQPLQAAIIDLNQGLPQVATMLRRTLGEQIVVELHPGTGLWPARVDPAQLDEAILNLAINARDAMPKGGTLSIETSNTHLDDDYAARHAEVKAGDYVQISISDTGVGMTPDVVERCFEPFFTTKGIEKGTGLGLSMVYGFVKQSGGHIKIYSEIGHGTSVKIYLPRAGAAAGARAEAPKAMPPAGSELILMVEDNKDLRTVTVKQLADLGYRTLEAENAKVALQMLAAHPEIDLLFTDIIMPGGMTGTELAREARRLYPKLKILLTSGYTARAMANGFHDIEGLELLNKPFRKRDLAQKLRTVLERG
ncbi:MAG TPA: PAS domain-containing protein [Dongiaceae bacterium]|jgi:PAS domain S-box-containing protein|nr:PAS domain-containing protein [Dongiaceae bacterium]